MTISKYTSHKLSILSLLMILMVVLIHSYYTECSDYPIASCVARILGGGGISRIAVPLFYIMSGFFFFCKVSTFSDCLSGIKKRTRTLLVPFVLWNVIFVLWYFVLSLLPGVNSFINSNICSAYSISKPFSSVLKLLIAPAGFHLWYLRDLIIVVLVSPFLYFLLKRIKWLTPIILCIVYNLFYKYLAPSLDSMGIDIHQGCSIAYFSLGGCFALCNHDWIKKYCQNVTFILAGCIFAIDSVFQPRYFILPLTVNVIVIVFGIIAVWGLYDYLYSSLIMKVEKRLLYLSSFSFFIYLFHEPTFNIIKKLGLKILGIHEWSLILLYLINPLIMCAVAIIVAKFLQRFVPRVYKILVGGR